MVLQAGEARALYAGFLGKGQPCPPLACILEHLNWATRPVNPEPVEIGVCGCRGVRDSPFGKTTASRCSVASWATAPAPGSSYRLCVFSES